MFSKEVTTVIKGLAILFMILHHCLIPEFYDNPSPELKYDIVIRLMVGMRICVGIFTFIIGYGYAFSKEHNYKYSVKHIYGLIKKYWLLLFFFFIPIAYINGYKIDSNIIYEMFGIKWNLNCASWYIYFYIFIMLLLPFIYKIIIRNTKRNAIVLIILFGILSSILKSENNLISNTLERCFYYAPILIIGFVFAKLKIFDKIVIKNNFLIIILLFFSIVIRCAISGIKGFSTDIICVPIFIFCIAYLYKNNDKTILFKILSELGKTSLYMWFIHAVFYSTATRSLFNEFIPENLILSYIFITLISYVLSKLCKKIENKLVQKYD